MNKLESSLSDLKKVYNFSSELRSPPTRYIQSELSGLESDSQVIKIVFTGGPCAGKTTAIATCIEKLR
jgi:hypothetical protein